MIRCQFLLSLLVALLPLLMASSASAAARTASVTGNWSSTATWGGSAVPGVGDTVTINTGVTVTVDTNNAVCTSVAMGTASGTATLTFAASGSPKLTVSGAVTVGNSGNANRRGTITFTSGSTLVCGSLSLGAVATQISTIDMSAGGTLSVGGAITAFSGAVWTPGTGTVEKTGTSTLPATIFTSFNNLTLNGGTTTLGVSVSITGDLTVTTGSLDLNALTANRSTAGGTFTVANGTTLLVGGTANFPSNYTTVSLGATSTVNYDNAGTQTVSAQTYGHLTISGSNTKTLAGNVGVAGDLTVSAGTLDLSGFTADRTSAGGTLTVANGATLSVGETFPANYSTVSLGTTSTVNYSKAGAQTVSAEAYGNLTTSGSGTKTLAGSLSVATVMTVGSGTTLDASSATITLSGSGTPLVVTGTFTPATSTVNYTSATGAAVAGTSFNNLGLGGSGTFTAAANLNVSDTMTVNSGATFAPGATVVLNSGGAAGTLTGSGDIRVTRIAATADLVNQYKFSTYTLSGMTVAYIGAGSQTINSTVGDYGALTNGGTGTKTLGGAVVVNGALSIASAITLDVSSGNNYALTVGGNWVGTGTFTPRNGTVTLNGGAQTINTTTTFHNLTLAGSGTKTIATVATIGGNLSLSGTASATTAVAMVITGNLDIGSGTAITFGNSITVTGIATVSGALTHTTTGTTKVFTGNVTINGGGTWTNSVNEAISFGGSLQNDGTFIAGTAVQTFTGAGKTFGGANEISIPSLTITSPGNYTNSGTLTVGTALAGTGSLTQGASAILNFGGTSTITTLVATAGGNTVNYNGAAQTVRAASYQHLTISGSATKTLGGSVTNGGDLTVSAGTLDLSTFTANRATAGGTFTLANSAALQVGGTANFPANYSTVSLGATSTVNYDNAGAQTVSAQTYGHLTISGSGTKTLAGAATIAGDLNVSAGTLDLSTFTADRTSAGGTLTVAASAILKVGGTGTMPANFSTRTLNATSTVEYSGAAQTVSAETYGNLTTSGSGTKTLAAGTTSIAGILTIGTGTTFDAGANDFSITGNWVNNGSFSASGAQTVSYTGTGSPTIGGSATTTFNNLTINKSGGTATANADFTVTSVFTIQAGTFAGSARTITLAGSGTPLVVTGTFTVNTSTIKYTSATGANVTGTSYYNLTLDSLGQTFTAAGDLTVSKVLTVAADTSFDASSRTINLTDTTSGATPFVVNGTFIPSTSTVFYNNTAATADNIAGVTYYNLTMAGNGSADTFTAAGDMTVQNVLTVGSAANATFNASSRTITLSGAGTPFVVNGIFTPATSTIRYTSATGANVTGGLTYNNLTLDSSGQTFTAAGNITNSSVLSVTGGTTFDASSRTIVLSAAGTPLVVSGTFTPSTSTVIYTSATGATVGAVNYNNLSFTGTGLFSLGGDIGIAGTCTVASGNQLSCGTSVINGAGTFTLASGGNLQIGSTDGISASAASGNVRTTTRSFNPGARYIYNGGAPQITGDGLPSSIAILTNNNSAGLTLSADVTVTNTLALTSGKITTGANAIIIPAVGSTIVGASSANYIVGNLQKAYNTGSGLAFTYTVGDVSTYAPVALGAMTVTVAGSVKASATSGEHPDVANSGINSARDVNRFWTLTASGITASTYNITNIFVAGDVDGGANTSLFVVRRYNGSTWAATTTGTRTATSASAIGLNAFSDFAVGEQLIDHYAVTGPSPNSAGVPFTNTVTAQDLLNQTVTGDSNTVVTMTSSGSAQFDSNGDDVFGDNTKTLTGGTFTIRTKDNVGETITITATDSNSKTGSQAGVVINAAAGAFRSVASGDWNSTSTWETFDGATWFAATNTPVSTNGVVTIQSGHTVTVTAGVTLDQVIVQSGGQVNVNSGVTLTIANGAGTDLEVFGIVQNAGTITINASADLVFQSGGKYQHNFTTTAGTIPTATWANGSTCEVIGYTSNTGTLAGFGQTFHNLTWNCPSQTAAMNLGATATTVNGNFIVTTTGTGSIVLGNNISVVSNLTVSAGTLDLATLTANRTASGGTLTLANGATLRLSGASNFPANYATHSLGASSSVDYYSGSAQTVAVEAYGNLTLSGATTGKTLQTGTTIAGNLTLTGSPTAATVENLSIGGNLDISGGTFTVGPHDFSVAGTTTVSGGSLQHTNATGTKTYTGLVTISGGTWSNTGNAPVNFRGGLTVSSGTFTAGSGVHTFDTNDQAINGTVTIPNATVTTVNLTNNGALTVSTALDGTGALINDATGTLNLTFTGSPGIAALTASASGNTVNYGAAGAQTVVPTAYHNLTLSSSGVKTMTGVTTIGGDLTLSGSATMTGNAGFTVTGALNYGSSGSTTLTVATPISIGELNQTAGTLIDNGNTITVTGTGANTWVRTAGTFTPTGTAIFTGAAPQIGAANFNHLTIGGTAAASTTGAVTVAGNLNVVSGASFSVGGFNITVSGATTVAGTLNHASTTGTKIFTGDVTINSGGTWTNGVNEPVSFAGSLTNDGTFVSGTGAQTFTGVGKNFAGTSGLTLTTVILSGASTSYTNTGTLTVATFNTSTGTLTQGAGATLNYTGAGGTFDAALVATASGNTVNYNAAGTQTAKPTAYYHLILANSGAKTMSGITSIAGDLTISGSATMTANAAFTVTGAFNYSSSGSTTLAASTPVAVTTFNQTAGTIIDNGSTITVTGTGASTWTMTGTFTPTGTVIFTGAAPQIGASNFRNLTINVGSGNTATLTGAITTAGTLTINSGTTLADGGFTITANGGVANNGTYSGAGKISLTGGAAAHTLSGAGSYANLEMNDANGATLTGSPTVNGTLTFVTGRITTGANSLILANSATVSGAGAGAYVAGNLQRDFLTGAGQSYSFAIGGAANYAPVNLTAMDVTTAGSLTASTTDGDHANLAGSGISAVDGVNRYWTLTAGTLAISTCDATYNFDASDLDAGADTSKFFVRRYSGGTWFTTTLGTRTATSISITGLTGFSDFAAGEQGIDHYQVTASSPQVAGATFTTTVTAQDALNETVVEDSSTVVTMTSSTGNAQYDSNGDATFGDNTKTLTAGTFTIDTKDNVAETVNLIATDPNSKTGTRTGLVINPTTATHLAFTTQPGAAVIGAPFGTQPVVRTRDQFGNTSTVGLGANVNVTVTLTAGTGPLQGTTTLDIGTAAGNGTVTFTDLQIDVPGADKQLTASATDFTNALSSVFTVKGFSTNAVASSSNPSLPGVNVTFTATLSAVSPATGTPTGTVQFVIDGSPFGSPVELSGGIASTNTDVLSHGSHTVAAEYLGDSLFVGSTNSLSPDQIVNTPPVAAPHTLGTRMNKAASMSTVKMLKTDNDADGDTMSITNVSPASAEGGSVSLGGTTITYTPPTDFIGDDSFTYTLVDSFGATNIGTVNVTVNSDTNTPQRVVAIETLPDNNVAITFAGIPGYTYFIQANTNLATATWTTIATNIAGANGLFTYSDLEATNYTSRYYRSSAD